MINLSETAPPPGQHLAELIEQLTDHAGNAARAARFQAALAEAIALIERVAEAPAVDLVQKLTVCQRSMQTLRDEAKRCAETSEQFKGQLLKRLDALKQIGA